MIQRLTDITTGTTAAFEKESKQLVVRIESNFITLALTDKHSHDWDTAEILGLTPADWQAEDFIAQVKQKSHLTAMAGLETKLFFETTTALPIPQTLTAHAATYLVVHSGQPDTEATTFTQPVNEEIALAFQVATTQINTLSTLFPRAAWGSTLGLLIQQALYKSSKNNWPVLYININHAVVELVLARQGQLLVAKPFVFETSADTLYHLLNCCRQFHLKPSEINVFVQGMLQADDERYRLLQNYFTHIGFVKASRGTTNAVFRQVPDHFFTGLTEIK